MADDQQFCLRWNNFQSNFTTQFEALRVNEDFVDVTLACEGKRIKAHKLVLSACSPYFKELFKGNPCKHPIIFMQDVEYEHLMNLVEFMYAGQVNICQTKLPSFLHTAESLQIRGLSAKSQNKLPQNSECKSGDLRPGPSLGDSPEPESHGSSPDHVPDDEGEVEGNQPNKRLCVPGIETNSHLTHESTSYNDVPTTALIETKMEPMDYYSDGEVKPNTSRNPVPDHALSRSGYTMQGAFDAAASISAQISQLHEASHEEMQGTFKMGEKRKKFVVTVEEKLRTLKRLDAGESAKKIASELGVGKSTIGDWKKNREQIEKWCSAQSSGSAIEVRKTMYQGKHTEVDEALYLWYEKLRGKGIPVNGPMLQEKALKLKKQIEGEGSEFTASDGWISRWKKRHGIVPPPISGEALSANKDAVPEF